MRPRFQSDDGVVVRLARRPNVKQVLLKHRQPHSGHASFGPSSITRAHSMHIATMLHCPRASAALLTSSGGSVVATFRLRPNRMGATFRPASRLAELVTRAYRLPSVAVAWEPRISLLFRRLPSSDSDSLRNLRWVGFASIEYRPRRSVLRPALVAPPGDRCRVAQRMPVIAAICFASKSLVTFRRRACASTVRSPSRRASRVGYRHAPRHALRPAVAGAGTPVGVTA